MSSKSVCPVTRAEFRNAAQGLEIVIDGSKVLAEVKEFSTGSLGWYANGKVAVKCGGKTVYVQVGLNLTIPNSKELPVD